MKKLIIAAAIALAGVAAQASALNWGISSGTLDTTKFASGTAYLISANDLALPTLTETTAGDWYKANIAGVKQKAILNPGSVAGGAFYIGGDESTSNFNRSRQGYWLLIDNNETADEDHFFAVSTLVKSVGFNPSSTSKVTTSWQASQFGVFNVPEPTSGLMLLLGMAGLALRRRRA